MKALFTSTNQIVTIKAIGYAGNKTKARVWEAVTDGGVPFVAYIPCVQVHKSQDNSQFEREFIEHAQPSPETKLAIDARMVI